MEQQGYGEQSRGQYAEWQGVRRAEHGGWVGTQRCVEVGTGMGVRRGG